jgi:hypothetical protein
MWVVFEWFLAAGAVKMVDLMAVGPIAGLLCA